MGQACAKQAVIVDFLTVKDTVRRIDECILPDDREPILDFLEGLEGRLSDEEKAEERADEFKDVDGPKILLKIFKRMNRDEVAVRLIVGVFEQLTDHVPAIMDFIQFGGLEQLEKANIQHENDDFLKIMIPNLLRAVLKIGAQAAIKEIKQERVALRLCMSCQEVIERENNPELIGQIIKIPPSSQRANRVLMFMENYPTRKEVQVIGLDALLVFARNSDCPSQIGDTKTISLCCQALKNFADDKDVMWRASLALSIVGDFQLENALEIATYDVHNIMAENFDKFEGMFRIQQQMLWCFTTLLRHTRSMRKVNASETCMTLFKRLTLLRENLIKSKTASIEDKYLPYETVLPYDIREFLRVTEGKVVPEEAYSERKRERKFRKRKEFEKSKPKFGTVESQFKAGVPGLV